MYSCRVTAFYKCLQRIAKLRKDFSIGSTPYRARHIALVKIVNRRMNVSNYRLNQRSNWEANAV